MRNKGKKKKFRKMENVISKQLGKGLNPKYKKYNKTNEKSKFSDLN